MDGRRRNPIWWAAVTLVLAGCALESGPAATGEDQDDVTTVRVGYLHTVAVDGHLWLGVAQDTFTEHGLQIEPVQFDTGIAVSQALTGGSIDVAVMGAVISNFPARGQGKVFLLNDIEYDTAQLWVHEQSGIESVAELAGQQVATTEGTTAHVFLHNALKEHGVDPASVELVNSAMPGAVNAFISGAVPAVALWAPFDLQVQENVPGARLVDSAKNYYPEAAIMGGWVASNEFYENDQDTLERLAAAWLDINDALTSDPNASLKTIHETGYEDDVAFDQLEHNFEFQTVFSNDEWAAHFEDGTAADWIGQVTETFVDLGGLPEYRDPATFFDPEIFLSAYQEVS